MPVIQDIKGRHWLKYHGSIVDEYPVDYTVTITEAKRLMSCNNADLIRWTNNHNYNQPMPFWWIVADIYDINKLKSESRYKINKGLKQCCVKKIINPSSIGNEAYFVLVEAFKRYIGSSKIPTREKFMRSLINMEKNKNEDLWCVYNNGEIAGWAVCAPYDSIKTTVVKGVRFHPLLLKKYSAYALWHEITNYYLNIKKHNRITNGTMSISHDTNIQNWLQQIFNYQKLYCKLEIVYSNRLSILMPFIILLNKTGIYKFRNGSAKLNSLNIIYTLEKIRKECETQMDYFNDRK